MKRFIFSAAVLSLAAPALAQEEQTVELTAVPKVAMDAAMARAEGATFEKAVIDNDEGTETYELSGKMADGMMIEVDVLADGTIEEVEKQIEASALPAAVSTALDATVPNMQPSIIEESTRPDGTVVYEFEGKNAEGKEVDVEINADGSNPKVIDDMAG